VFATKTFCSLPLIAPIILNPLSATFIVKTFVGFKKLIPVLIPLQFTLLIKLVDANNSPVPSSYQKPFSANSIGGLVGV
jgi:hypothetical protein